jgi:2-oxoisovalerate dehydrogenase E1 component beta subunit
MFLEPVRLYRAMRQEVADDGRALPLDAVLRAARGQRRDHRHLGRHDLETLRAASRTRQARDRAPR